MARIPESERLFALTAHERVFWENPEIVLAGMDEVGRGPLAGPVVAACVVLPKEPLISYVNDSKKVSEKRRESVSTEILTKAVAVGFGFVEPSAIDEINILEATRRAMRLAYLDMGLAATDLLVDALKNLDIPTRQHPLIHGDALSYLIAAASIVAKVRRDQYMLEQALLYPQYGFEKNKGYGTAAHIQALREYGPTPIHRHSFITKLL